MKSIKATKNFSLNGVFYEKGNEVKIENIRDLVRLNEKGFINPLSAKDLQDYKIELEKIKKINNKGE